MLITYNNCFNTTKKANTSENYKELDEEGKSFVRNFRKIKTKYTISIKEELFSNKLFAFLWLTYDLCDD
jgi:hypothetical protein